MILIDEQKIAIQGLLDRGHTLMSASRCIGSNSYGAIRQAFPEPYPHTPTRAELDPSGAWMQHPWIWRQDNQNPTEAPWERTVK